MAVELRPATAVLVLVAVLVAGSFGSIALTEATGGDADPESGLRMITLDDDDRQLWLYTSRGLSFQEGTLAINVVVYGDTEDVHRRLLESGQGNWTATEDDEQEVAPDEQTGVLNATTIEWESADGSNRYVYLTGLQGGQWLSESYQVHDGTYLGSRHHIRAYTAPEEGGEWTAMQAHHEHWDWFMGRHIVTSVGSSQSYVEREFSDGATGPEITREPVRGQNRPGFDKWLTVVDFRSSPSQVAAAAVLLGLGAVGRRSDDVEAAFREYFPEADARAFLLAAGIVGVLSFVRIAGISLEQSLNVQPKAFAVALYPVLFAGLPATAYLLAQELDRTRAFVGASVGFIAGILVDYSYLGVTNIPLDVLVHRGTLAVALGLIAVGGCRAERPVDSPDHVRIGVLLWLVATLLPLLRHTALPV